MVNRERDVKKQMNSPSTPIAAKRNRASPPITPQNQIGINMQEIKNEPVSPCNTQYLMPPQATVPETPIQYTLHVNINAHLAQMSRLVMHVIQENPNILPTDPLQQPITSAHINDFTHAMWQVAFQNGGMLQRACQYGAMFSPLKLAALAKLNYLPSWWYFRSVAVLDFKGPEKTWWVDDREEEETFQEAVRWCVKVLGKRGENGGGDENGAERVKREADDQVEQQRALWS